MISKVMWHKGEETLLDVQGCGLSHGYKWRGDKPISEHQDKWRK